MSQQPPPRRVVITGLGCVSPIGRERNELNRILAGASAREFDPFLPRADDSAFLGRLADWQPESLDPPSRLRMCPSAQYALVAAQDALADAGLMLDQVDRTRVGVCVGTMLGGIQEVARTFQLLEAGKKSRAGAMGTTKFMNSASAVGVATALGLRGPAISVSSAFASGLDNIGYGYEQIQRGDLDVVIGGATEEDCASILGPSLAAWDISRGDRRSESRPCVPQPFDVSRCGPVLSAGSGIVILESFAHAADRGARMLSEIVAYDGCFHGRPHVDDVETPLAAALQRVMSQFVKRGGGRIDHVLCGAAGFGEGDRQYAAAIGDVLGNAPWTTSLRGLTGFPLGAGSALDVVFAVMMQETGSIAPTFRLQSPAPECTGVRHLLEPIQQRIERSLIAAAGLGYGSALILELPRNGSSH